MAYPKIKVKGTPGEICLTPELLQEVGRQVPAQFKSMSWSEMFALWSAGSQAVTAIKNAPGIANLIVLFKH